MHIAALLGSVSQNTGGPAYSVRRLWQSALRPGVSVTVHTVNNMGFDERDEDYRIWAPVECRLWPTRGAKVLGYSRTMRAGLLKELRGKSALISQHGLWMYQGRLVNQLRDELKVPVIIHPHGMLEPWALNRSGWKKKIVGALWEYENLRRATCLRVTAESELESVRRFGSKVPVAVIPCGIDVNDYDHLPSREDAATVLPQLGGRRVLLFLSRVHPKKGLMRLLKIWKRLSAEHPEWLLAICGPDEVGHTGQLERAVEELALGDAVVFCGALFGEAKLAALSLAELFILPAFSENFGVAIAGALAARLPVITTKGTPWHGLEGNGCGWWADNEEQAIEDALREALPMGAPQLREMGERGREWVRCDYDWDLIGDQMLSVSEWMLGGGAAPACVELN
jgi:glycosyltransferase involved in cell wall biosynthesis